MQVIHLTKCRKPVLNAVIYFSKRTDIISKDFGSVRSDAVQTKKKSNKCSWSGQKKRSSNIEA